MNNQVTEDVLIELPSHGHGKIFVNGVELTEVFSIRFEASPGVPNKVTVTLMPRRVKIVAPALVTREGTLPDADADGLIETTNLESESRTYARPHG